MHDPFALTRDRVPAIAAAALAGGLIAAFAGSIGFLWLPPTANGPFGQATLDAAALGHIAGELIWPDHCAAVGARSCRADIVAYLGHQPAIVLGRLIALVLAPLAAGAVAYRHRLAAAPQVETVRTLRGRRPRYDADGRRSLRDALTNFGPADRVSSLWLAPHVALPAAAEAQNILLVGGHGSGKTATLRAYIEQVLARGDALLLHDVKGDVTARGPAR